MVWQGDSNYRRNGTYKVTDTTVKFSSLYIYLLGDPFYKFIDGTFTNNTLTMKYCRVYNDGTEGSILTALLYKK